MKWLMLIDDAGDRGTTVLNLNRVAAMHTDATGVMIRFTNVTATLHIRSRSNETPHDTLVRLCTQLGIEYAR